MSIFFSMLCTKNYSNRFNLTELFKKKLEWRFWYTAVVVTTICRMTNYELLRWLVETLSRDVYHCRMMNASRSTVRHFQPRFIISECRTHYRASSLYIVRRVMNWRSCIVYNKANGRFARGPRDSPTFGAKDNAFSRATRVLASCRVPRTTDGVSR